MNDANSCGIRIRITDPWALWMDGKYVVEYDPSRPGMTEEGIGLICHLVVTDDPAQARRFPGILEALEFWRSPGRRLFAIGLEGCA